MIDLHTHTIFSDGTWTLEEMLTNAEKANISILAITDHDTALPHIKLKDIDIKKFFSGRVIVGGEFNAIFKNTKIELLGYNFNPVQLQNWIDNTYNKKEEIQGYKEEFLEILELCKKLDKYYKTKFYSSMYIIIYKNNSEYIHPNIVNIFENYININSKEKKIDLNCNAVMDNDFVEIIENLESINKELLKIK